jgi:CMP/dCMP kinase
MPVITISRQIGSNGEKIAQDLCDLLGYSYFDKSLLVSEAVKLGLTEREIIDFSEENYKTQTLIERLFSPGVRVVTSTEIRQRDESGIEKKFTRHLDESDHIHMIRQVINVAHNRGNMVIVGRGGQVVLQRKPDVLHVRLVAPLDLRISRLRKEKFWDVEKTLQYALERDKATTEYLYRFFKVQWDDPTLYNLTLNTGELTHEEVIDKINNAIESLAQAA